MRRKNREIECILDEKVILHRDNNNNNNIPITTTILYLCKIIKLSHCGIIKSYMHSWENENNVNKILIDHWKDSSVYSMNHNIS